MCVCREWLLLPFCDRSLIVHRQDGVAMAARSDNIDFVGAVVRLLKHIHDVPALLLRIKKVSECIVCVQDCISYHATLYSILSVYILQSGGVILIVLCAYGVAGQCILLGVAPSLPVA